MWLSKYSIIGMRKPSGKKKKDSRPNINSWLLPSARGLPGQHPVLGLLATLQPHHQEIAFAVAILATGPKPVLILATTLSHAPSMVNGDTGNGSAHRVAPSPHQVSVPPANVPETPLYQLLE
jgi:hypothetical protein